MKHRNTVASLLLTALLAAQANADDEGLARCAQIAGPSERLACYDSLANAAGRSVPAAAPAPATVNQVPAPAAAAEPPPADSLDSFGFESKVFKNTSDEIVARYVGEFSGWSGGTLFKLDNGQVWKQAQSGRVFHRRDNPVITIRRGALRSFRLSVEGTNRTVRVKRVK